MPRFPAMKTLPPEQVGGSHRAEVEVRGVVGSPGGGREVVQSSLSVGLSEQDRVAVVDSPGEALV